MTPTAKHKAAQKENAATDRVELSATTKTRLESMLANVLATADQARCAEAELPTTVPAKATKKGKG